MSSTTDGNQDEAPGIEEIRASRERSLLERWGKGQRLSNSELEEIRHLIGTDGEANQSEGESTSGQINAVDLKAEDDELAGKSAKRITSEAYEEKISFYSSLYRRSDRTIKSWIKTGREASGGPDLPPLDSPPRMLDWYRRFHRNKAPAILEEFALNKERGGGGDSTSQGGAPRPQRELVLPDGSGFAAELERIRERCRVRAAELEEAEKRGTEADVRSASVNYQNAVELLRKFERDAQKIMEGQGDLVPRALAEEKFLEKLSALKTHLQKAAVRIDPRLKKASDQGERNEIWLSALDDCFRLAAESDFQLRAA